MNADKIRFLKEEFVPAIAAIPSHTPPVFGKMSLQQMTEHFADSVRIASGRMEIKKVFTPEENLSRMREFLQSDKPFRENTVNPMVPETPAPVKHDSLTGALKELQDEIDFFFDYFSRNHESTTRNPFFGDLNFEQNVQLLHKHAVHHLRQFGA